MNYLFDNAEYKRTKIFCIKFESMLLYSILFGHNSSKLTMYVNMLIVSGPRSKDQDEILNSSINV